MHTGPSELRPAGHDRHEACPNSGWYLPGAQPAHGDVGDEQEVAVRPIRVSDPEHVRVVETRRQARLLEEVLHEARIGLVEGQDPLHADVLLETARPPPHREEGLGHATGAQVADELVGAEVLQRHRRAALA